MRNNVVLIDFESVPSERLALLDKEHIKVIIFVGANQSKLSFETVSAVQRLGDRAQYIKISGTGPNALDFHIAFYIGQLAAADPTAFFHIISKDKGFDPLIQHLRDRKIFAARTEEVTEILVEKSASSVTPAERVSAVLAKLDRIKASRPRTLTTLSSTIAALFQKQLSEQEIGEIVQALVSGGHLSVNEMKVSYTQPQEA